MLLCFYFLVVFTFLYLFISLYCILFIIVVRSSWVFRKVAINKMVYYYLIHLIIPSRVTFLFFLSYVMFPISDLTSCLCFFFQFWLFSPLSWDSPASNCSHPLLSVCFSSSLCQSRFVPKVSNNLQVNLLFAICYYALFLLPVSHTKTHLCK